MSQSDFGTIVAATKSGTALASDLNAWRTALYSMHSGTSRPSYIVAGMCWLDTTGTPWIIKMYDGAADIVLGKVDASTDLFTPGALLLKGANIASATTTDLNAATGEFVHITGSVTITGFGTAPAGRIIEVVFDAAPLITYNATSLILPGAASIQAAAGDSAIMVSEGSGNWRCISYSPAARSAIQNGALTVTTSGTSIDFTSIPPWAKRITLMFNSVSTNGTSIPLIQIGDSGGIENAGYVGNAGFLNATPAVGNFTTGFGMSDSALAASVRSGMMTLQLMNASTFLWACSGVIADTNGANCPVAGVKSLSAALDRVRLTTVGGADTFDAGSMNISWE